MCITDKRSFEEAARSGKMWGLWQNDVPASTTAAAAAPVPVNSTAPPTFKPKPGDAGGVSAGTPMGLLTPAFTAGSPGYKTLTGL